MRAEDRFRTFERRSHILNILNEDGRVRVADLVAALGVTDTSIRRDLVCLEGEGRLRRVHGGAVTLPADPRAQRFTEKQSLRLTEKRRIGAAAAEMVEPGDVLIVDSGTTTLQVAAAISGTLRSGGMLTVVTNSLPLVDELRTWPAPNLVLLGGYYLPDYQATVGPQAIEQLSLISADKVFLGADGLTVAEGITTGHVLMADVDRLMAERARQVILTTDSSKLGRPGLARVIAIQQIHVVITDQEAPVDIVNALRAEGVEVRLV
jgi:DeoR family transcriptional regulator, aga operon transcriptional repressor